MKTTSDRAVKIAVEPLPNDSVIEDGLLDFLRQTGSKRYGGRQVSFLRKLGSDWVNGNADTVTDPDLLISYIPDSLSVKMKNPRSRKWMIVSSQIPTDLLVGNFSTMLGMLGV